MGASRWARHCAAAILGLSALFGASGASAQGMVKNTFGEWQMRCETPAGATAEQCALVQNVVAEDRPNVTLVIIVLKTADGKNRLLRVVAPLGILLPSGLGLKIDETDIGRAGFVRCLATGCVAEVVMEEPEPAAPVDADVGDGSRQRVRRFVLAHGAVHVAAHREAVGALRHGRALGAREGVRSGARPARLHGL